LGLTLFLLIPTAICLAVVAHYATRSVELEIRGGVMAVRFTGLFGVRVREIPVKSIQWFIVGVNQYVRIGSGGGRSGGRPVPQLHIAVANQTRPLGLGTGRPIEELHWLAFILNKTLGLHPHYR
jgi:hypothetical protein